MSARILTLLFWITTSAPAQHLAEVELFLDQEKPYQALFYLNRLRSDARVNKHPDSIFAVNNRLIEAHFLNQSHRDTLSLYISANQQLLSRVRSSDELQYFDYAKAVALSTNQLAEALKRISSLTFSNTRLLGNAYLRIGDWSDILGHHDESLVYLQKALQAFRTDSARYYYKIYRCHYLSGLAAKSSLQYDLAEREYRLALKILDNAPEPFWPEKSRIQNNLANVYNESNRYRLAIDHYSQSIIIKQKYLHDSASLATSYANLASFYTRYGNFSQAAHNFDQTLKLLPAPRNPRDQIRKNVIMSNYTGLLREFGQFQQAQLLLNEALQQSEHVLPPGDPSILRLKLRLAENAISWDEQVEAGQFISEVAAQVTASDPIYTEYAITLSNYLLTKELYDSCYRLCTRLMESPGVTLRAEERHYLLIKAGNCIEHQSAQEALPWYRQAYTLAKETEQLHKVIESLDLMAIVNVSLGQLDSAELQTRYGNHLNLVAPAVEGDSLQFRDVNLAIGGYLRLAKISLQRYRQGKPAQLEHAVKNIQVALQLIQHKRTQLQFEQDQFEFGDFVQEAYQVALDIYFESYLTGAPVFNALFEQAERDKAQSLLTTLKHQGVDRFAGVTEAVYQKENEILLRERALAYDLAYVLNQQQTENQEVLTDKLQELNLLNHTRKSFLDSLQNHLPGYFQLKYSQTCVTPTELMTTLPKHTLLIEFAQGLTNHYVLGISQSGSFALRLSDHAAIDRLVTLIRNQLRLKDERVRTTAASLFDLLLKPIDSLIQARHWRIDELVIIPDGDLTLLPFELLVQTGKREMYLLEKYRLYYNYSATLHWQKMTDPAYALGKGLVGFAPQFGNSIANPNSVREEWMENFQFTELPETKAEVEYLAEVYKKHKQGPVKVFDQEANEATFKSLPFDRYSLVHLATHGFAGLQGPRHSGIAFSRNSQQEDDILFAEEVYNLHLPLELVTLSACETGLGKYYAGEGLVGLTRGFFYAGTRSVLVTLWKVQDNSSAELMKNFYLDYLGKGRTKAQALRQAKLNMIRSDTWNHPYYWSAFVLLGAN